MNWKPSKLQGGAQYVRGYGWSSYVAPYEAGECDAIGLVGAHARAGWDDGVLSHTVNADGWYAVLLNGREIGESAILAAIAGSYGVPVACISGDQAACSELIEFVGAPVACAPVKSGLGRYAARMLAPSEACALIECTFAGALAARNAWATVRSACEASVIRVELASSDRARTIAQSEGVRAVGPRTVEAEGDTFAEAWRRIWNRS
jgi:D-amino peptidase